MDRLSNQAATLKRVLDPSDDPPATMKILELRTALMNNQQYNYNAGLARSQLEAADGALSDMTELLLRAKELALGMASDASSSDASRRATAQEVQALTDSAKVLANRKLGEKYLFGGFQISSAPVDSDGNYQGDLGTMQIEIEPGAFLTINITGDALLNAPTTSKNTDSDDMQDNKDGNAELSNQKTDNRVNLFDALRRFNIALLTGDIETIRQGISDFTLLHENIVTLRAKVGSRLSNLESNVLALDKQLETSTQLMSELEDADLAAVVTELTKQESVYKNALASSKRLIQPSLLDFLK